MTGIISKVSLPTSKQKAKSQFLLQSKACRGPHEQHSRKDTQTLHTIDDTRKIASYILAFSQKPSL